MDSYTVFLELLPAIHTTLLGMVSSADIEQLGTDWNWDGETVMKANGFIHQLESSTYLISFKILLECLTHVRGLTVKLQMQAIDVLYAYKQVSYVISSLKSLRESAISTFCRIFKETTHLGKSLHGEDFEIKKPRLNARQVYRDNVEASSSAENYFRITLYNDVLSHMISELEERFTVTPTHSIGLLMLMPHESTKRYRDTELPDELSQVTDFYKTDLPHPVMLPNENRMWVTKWKQSGLNIPEKLMDTFKSCDPVFSPNIHVLLHLALTLPITSCECERSFSQLKLNKTSHRSTVPAS